MDNRNIDNNGRIWAGILLLLFGVLLFAYKSGAPLPHWLFTWPMILIGVGLVNGFRHQFRHPAWIILVGLGVFFLSDNFIPDWHARQFVLPVVLMGIGLVFIFRPKRRLGFHGHWEERKLRRENAFNPQAEPSDSFKQEDAKSTDYVRSVSVFAGIKKRVASKDFRGGEVVCFMGGSEIDLTQSDIVNIAELEVTMVFGGTKLIVPSNWTIKSEMAAIFAGIEDKRHINNVMPDENKVLLLKGTSVFGGIEIRSY